MRIRGAGFAARRRAIVAAMSTPRPGVPIERDPLPRPEPPPAGSRPVRDPSSAWRASWILGGALLIGLAVVVGQVLSHFATALTWAVILAVSLWPVHRRIRDRLGDLGVPMVYGLSFGHIRDNLTLPYGVQAELDADNATLTYLEPAVI